MVTIQKDGKFLTVTMGAYKTLFKSMGFAIVSPEESRVPSYEPGNDITPSDDYDGVEDDLEPPEDDFNDPGNDTDEDEESEDDEEEPEDELDETPLSEMNFEELKTYAKRLGVNIRGMNSKKELRAAISEHLRDGDS